jgi:RNA polymerase sigma factor (sigma-70 family)
MHSNLRKDLTNQQQQKIEDYMPTLLAYCQFLTKSRWDGEDIAQETALKAIEKYGHNPEVISSALLKKMAYNQWIDTVRKRKKEAIEDEIENKCNMNGHSPVDIMDLIQQLINHFTPKQAVILFLKEAFRYQSKEIADILGTTEMAVKSTLYRSKKRIENKDRNKTEFIWEKEEEQLLTGLFHDSLTQQDPSILIRYIPVIHSLTRQSVTPIPSKTLSPLSVLCMAA